MAEQTPKKPRARKTAEAPPPLPPDRPGMVRRLGRWLWRGFLAVVAGFAVLIVLFNLIADILYGILDPRIRYD